MFNFRITVVALSYLAMPRDRTRPTVIPTRFQSYSGVMGDSVNLFKTFSTAALVMALSRGN